MKTLTTISFLLLAVIGYGQSKGFTVIDGDTVEELPYYPGTIRQLIHVEKPLTVDRFTELWKEYKAECYNDSTLSEWHSYPLCPLNIACSVESHFSNEWVHRNPTFEGFMNWLITKEGKQ